MEAHSKQLHFSLTTSRPDKLAASTLRLLTAMVMQGPATAKEISSWFNFTYKPVDLLANRTDKIQVCVDVKWKRLKLIKTKFLQHILSKTLNNGELVSS